MLTPEAKQILADFRARAAKLIEQAEGTDSYGFVIKCGPLYILKVGADKVSAIGVENASRFSSRSDAYRHAKWIQNGAGAKGEVVRFNEALLAEAANLYELANNLEGKVA